MDGIPAPADRAPTRSLPPRSPAPVLAGRAREQACLRDELAAAVAGKGRLVLLGGEAGIGKTTLARDLVRTAEAQGVRVLAGHCYDRSNAPPYGPWRDAFERLPAGQPVPDPPAALAGGAPARVTDQAALFADVRRYLAELAAARPLFILLEDVHWADPASIDLLRDIAVSLDQWPALLVATYRIDALAPRHPFFQHLVALVREANGLRLDLKGLDMGAFHALVAAGYRLSGPDAARLVAYLERHADGNPFFAVELLRALEEDGLLRAGEDRSSLGELTRVVVPTLLRQVIDGRIARLGEDTRLPLAIAAVIGQEVPLGLWAALSGLDEDALLAIVERAVDAHLLEAEQDGIHVRFIHALTREALVEGLLPPRQRLWHRRVAEALAADPGADPDAVALHFQQAGDPRAWIWLVEAADRAQRVYAWLTASERLQAAVTILDGVDGQDRLYRELVFRVAYLLRFSDPAGTILALDEVERLARHVGDPVLTAEVQHIRGIHLCYTDRFQSGLTEMRTGLGALAARPPDVAETTAGIRLWFANMISTATLAHPSEDAAVVARLHAAGFDARSCVYSWFLASVGQPAAAAAAAERFVAAVGPAPGPGGWIRAILAFALHGLGIAKTALGRPDEARRAWAQSREMFHEVDHFALIAFSLLGELRDIALTYGAADPAVRRRLSAEGEATLRRTGGALPLGVSPRLAWLGCLFLDGRWDEADQILADLSVPGNTYLRREMSTTLAVLARHRGEPERAWAQIRSLLPDGPVTEPGDIVHQEGLSLQRLAADLCLDSGDLPTARHWLEAHDRWLAWSGSVLGQAEGRLAWARYHRAGGDAVRAREAAKEALGLADDPRQPLVWLATHRLLGELDTAAGEHAAAETHLAIALDLATNGELPFERALTLLALAELRLGAGKREDVAALLGDVHRICTPLGAGPTLARADALGTRLAAKKMDETVPAGLTRREVDVLRLLAQHCANAEIAEALFVSPRTVETHVEHILAKLGVRTRWEAAEAAARLGLV